MKFRDQLHLRDEIKRRFLRYVDSDVPAVRSDLLALAPLYIKLLETKIGRGRTVLKSLSAWQDDIQYYISGMTATGGRFPTFELALAGPFAEGGNELLQQLPKLRTLFQEFISKYCLDEAWLKSGLFEFLRRFAVSNESDVPLSGAHKVSFFDNYSYTKPLRFETEKWDLTCEDSKTFKIETVGQFSRFLDDHIEQTIAQAKDAGLTESRGRGFDHDRVRWMVRWTVQKKTISEICDEFGTIKQNVMDARKKFESFGIPNRKG